MVRFFIAGIMQGSEVDAALHHQGYRDHVRRLLERHFPGSEVYDPQAAHAGSLDYDDATGRTVFLRHNKMCREVDVVVAFVPEASMGTAIEMWEAYRHGRMVVTISPLKHNWVVKFCSHVIYPDLESFEESLQRGPLPATIREWTS